MEDIAIGIDQAQVATGIDAVGELGDEPGVSGFTGGIWRGVAGADVGLADETWEADALDDAVEGPLDFCGGTQARLVADGGAERCGIDAGDAEDVAVCGLGGGVSEGERGAGGGGFEGKAESGRAGEQSRVITGGLDE